MMNAKRNRRPWLLLALAALCCGSWPTTALCCGCDDDGAATALATPGVSPAPVAAGSHLMAASPVDDCDCSCLGAAAGPYFKRNYFVPPVAAPALHPRRATWSLPCPASRVAAAHPAATGPPQAPAPRRLPSRAPPRHY